MEREPFTRRIQLQWFPAAAYHEDPKDTTTTKSLLCKTFFVCFVLFANS
jgi:hypothetical protein